MELELRHLRVVVAVADAGSIGAGARALGLDQPLVSRQLRRIESELGVALFHRDSGGATLTAAGAEFVQRARPLLDDVEELLLRARAATSPLRFGASALGVLAGELIDALDALVGTPVSAFTHHSSEHLLTQLASGELDLALVAEYEGTRLAFPAQARHLVLVESEPALVALAVGHPLAAKEPLQLADLRSEWWVLQGLAEDGEREAFTAACRAAGFTPRVRHVTDDVSFARRAVTSGQAVLTVLPQSVQREGYVLRTLEGDPLHRRLHLAWQPQRLPVVAEEMLASIRDVYGREAGANPAFERWWSEHGWPSQPPLRVAGSPLGG
jgi:DNA-binding transcriptional LysR family regulator